MSACENYKNFSLSRINGKEYYFDSKLYYEDNQSLSGVFFADGAYYYYDGQGSRTKVTFKEGWNNFSGHWYYVKNGQLDTSVQGYFFDRHKELITNQFVLLTYQDNRPLIVYVNENGSIVKGWRTIDGERYYFDTNGNLLTGKHVIDGKTYIFKFTDYIYE